VLTKAQIEAAGTALEGGKLAEVAQQQWLTLIRSLPAYREHPGLYPDLTGKLASATGVTAKILQAALTEIERLLSKAGGMQDVSLSKNIEWSLSENVAVLVMDGLNALYEVPARRPTSAVRRIGSGNCATHQRSLSACGCVATRLIF
jgi:hypothetical protein